MKRKHGYKDKDFWLPRGITHDSIRFDAGQLDKDLSKKEWMRCVEIPISKEEFLESTKSVWPFSVKPATKVTPPLAFPVLFPRLSHLYPFEEVGKLPLQG